MHETSTTATGVCKDAVDALECELDFLRHTRADSHAALLLDADDTGADIAASTVRNGGDDGGDWPFGRADAFPLAAAKRPPAWTRRLVITKQPASEFYKDEGGKANALEVEVTLVEFNELGESARSPDDEFIDIPLRILLFFESGKRVDDTDQEIFRFVGNDYDSVVIRRHSRKASVQFRLEKVSRRKDGQRFKLRIEVDQEQCTANVSDLTPIFTNAICVLSKRKHHHTYESSLRAKEPAPKLLKRDLVKLDEKLSSKVDAMVAEMAQVKHQLQKQSELLARLLQPAPAVEAIGGSCESVSLEWMLKSNLGDDHTFAAAKPFPSHHLHHPHPHHHHHQQQQLEQLEQQEQQQSQATMAAYLTSSDDAYETEETQFSPASSDMSVVELLPTSLTFAEF